MTAPRRQTGWRELTREGRRYPLLCFTNAWCDSFYTHHDLTGKDDVPAVEVKKKFGAMEDELTIFLQASEYFSSRCEADVVKRYCDGFSLKDVEAGIGRGETGVASWIDDRNSQDLKGRGKARVREDWLTATGLLRYLKRPRYNDGDEPDAERRLVYIENLTPEFILALAATAPLLQVPVLRDAIYKHVSFQPSIRVKVPSDGMPTFHMEFHLPFFALREPSTPNGTLPKAPRKLLRNRKDLSLLRQESTGPEDQENYWLYQAEVSCVVYGCDEWQWTAYAFVDTKHDGDEDGNGNDIYDSENEVDCFQQEIDEDPIASVRARQPIWRPRQYFLKAFETRVQEPRREWDELVHRLVVDIREYKRAHLFTSADASRNPRERGEEMKRSFNGTLQRMSLLSELMDVLRGTIDEWNTFISPDGDIDYFSDLDEFPINSGQFRDPGGAGPSLRSIKETFEKLKYHQQKLESLTDSLSRDFEALKLRLSLEGHDATEHASFTSTFLIWALYPITLAASIFSMQPSVIPFGLTPGWFYITVFILIGVMCVIYWLMKKWALWQKELAVWMKVRQIEEEGRCELEREFGDVIPGTYRHRAGGDEESLGTRAILGRSIV